MGKLSKMRKTKAENIGNVGIKKLQTIRRVKRLIVPLESANNWKGHNKQNYKNCECMTKVLQANSMTILDIAQAKNAFIADIYYELSQICCSKSHEFNNLHNNINLRCQMFLKNRGMYEEQKIVDPIPHKQLPKKQGSEGLSLPNKEPKKEPKWQATLQEVKNKL